MTYASLLDSCHLAKDVVTAEQQTTVAKDSSPMPLRVAQPMRCTSNGWYVQPRSGRQLTGRSELTLDLVASLELKVPAPRSPAIPETHPTC